MRLDRLITLHLSHPARRLWSALRPSDGRRIEGEVSIPVLMYHSISDDPEPGVSPYYRVNTSPSVFRHHMRYLADHGYQTITLDDLVSWLKLQTRNPQAPVSPTLALPSRPVVLTFDDGFRNFYTEAFPAMQQHAFTATMFLPTAFIGESRRDGGFKRGGAKPATSPFRDPNCEFLSWEEVRELRRAGIDFGSHSVTHPELVKMEWREIQSEIADSKTEIEQQLGQPVTTFCYPYAFPQAERGFAGRFKELLAGAGYRCCATTLLGCVQGGDDAYLLKRLPANGLDDPQFFAAKLAGAYDWLASPQALAKRLKRLTTRPKPVAADARRLKSIPLPKADQSLLAPAAATSTQAQIPAGLKTPHGSSIPGRNQCVN